MSKLTDTHCDLRAMAAPYVVVEVKTELLKNSVVDTTYTETFTLTEFGSEPAAPIWAHWYLSNDGADVWETKLTLTHWADEMPLKFEFDYDELDTVTLNLSTHSATFELTGGSASQTYSPSALNRTSSYPTQTFTLTGYKAPY